MTFEMQKKILAKVPDFVEKILIDEGSSKMIREVVEEYSIYGSVIGRAVFFITESEMLNHAKRTIGNPEYTLEIDPSRIVITRTMKDSSKFVATYKPVLNIDEEVA